MITQNGKKQEHRFPMNYFCRRWRYVRTSECLGINAKDV